MDYNLPLFGRNSVVGRSIVIHKSDGNKRWVCANLEPSVDSKSTFFVKTETHFTGPEIEGMILIVSDVGRVETENTVILLFLLCFNLSYFSVLK